MKWLLNFKNYDSNDFRHTSNHFVLDILYYNCRRLVSFIYWSANTRQQGNHRGYKGWEGREEENEQINKINFNIYAVFVVNQSV